MAACCCAQVLEGKIVDACAGLPLMLELAGKKLRFKRYVEQWQVTVLLHTLHALLTLLSSFVKSKQICARRLCVFNTKGGLCFTSRWRIRF
jgi:hypothetical protein